MALAEKYGKNKYVWRDNVENFILLKSNEEYFTDPVCKNGYFRGIETYNFVAALMLSSGFCSFPGGTPMARAVAGISCISPFAPAHETAVVSKLDSV